MRINNAIIEYLSPIDLTLWSHSTLSSAGYDEKNDLKVFANETLPVAWANVRKRAVAAFKLTDNEEADLQPLEDPIQREAKAFSTLIATNKTLLKSIQTSTHENEDAKREAVRNSLFVQTLTQDPYETMMSVLLDDKLTDTDKAEAVSHLKSFGVVFDESKQATLKYKKSNDECCCVEDCYCYPTNWITCWLIGFMITNTGYYCCAGCGCCTEGERHGCCRLSDPSVPWTPLLASTFHAGNKTTAMIRDTYPSQEATAMRSIHTMKKIRYGTYCRSEKGSPTVTTYDTEAIEKAHVAILLLKSNYTGKELAILFQDACAKLEKLTNTETSLNFYMETIKLRWINQRETHWFDYCGLFSNRDNYSKFKIDFIVSCQKKLMALCLKQRDQLKPKPYLELCISLKSHDVFNEAHYQHGVDDTVLRELKNAITTVDAHVKSKKSFSTETTPLLSQK